VTIEHLKENGTLTLTGNTGGLDLASITLSGLAYVQNNTGTAPVTVSGNAINGSLYCTGNTPPPGDNGTVSTVAGTATGQCAALAKR
jgi:5'-nucleotidase